MHRRTKSSLVGTILPILIFLAASITLEKTLKFKDDLNPNPVSFKTYRQINPSYVMVYSDAIKDNEIVKNIENTTAKFIKDDTGIEPKLYRFQTIEEMNKEVYQMASNSSKEDLNILIGLQINDTIKDDYLPITVIYNSTLSEGNPTEIQSFEQLHRIIWAATGNGNFTVRSVTLQSKAITQLTGAITPMFVLIGMFTLCNLYGRQVIEDVKKEKRAYMQTCKLDLLSYWVGCFIVDYAIWVIISLIQWGILLVFGSLAFKEHPGASLYGFMVSGLSIIILTYSISFIFDEPATGSSYTLFILFIPMIIVYIIELLRGSKGNSQIFYWIYACYPVTDAYKFITLLINTKEDFIGMWSNAEIKPLLVMMLADIPIYSIILLVVEWGRVKIAKKYTEIMFSDYTNFFAAEKAKRNITEEAVQMERDVENSDASTYAVKASHVSRLFFNSQGNPIAAVNDVSLGVKRGELFGFLGANGAGKTTMMNMIMSNIPPSHGKIEIDGVDIAQSSERQMLSICPQFNDHLTNELTPVEMIRFFGKIFNLPQERVDVFINEYIPLLELEEHKDKTVQELSGGNARKLAVLIAFMSPADIILLDEPTSSLDPVARHKVHELISRFRGQKTFMLCTHLLDEAESLCDNISMMISGCVYTVGSPQHLSSRFGTEFKVDVLLESESAMTNVKGFFIRTFPTSKITTQRQKNIIYSIPSSDIEIADLFQTMKGAVAQNIGIKYFTCSSSSLEKVFLELIIRSEQEDSQEAANQQNFAL